MDAPLQPLAVITGPTGSGKSHLALEIARQCKGEIVNADSLQLYRGFDIGTAKPSAAERSEFPHHLFDVLEAAQSYSAGEFARLARMVIEEISKRGNLPVVVGGTGFYLRALFEGLPALPERDPILRARLVDRENRRPGSLHRLLARLDPGAARRIHANDVQKLIRALEIRLLTHRALPSPDEAEALRGYRIVKLGLNPERAALHQRLEARTKAMFEGGLIEEVRGLMERGATGKEKPFESLGYRQALEYIRGRMTREQAIESTYLETRQYAKRQWTWFRRDPEIFWIGGFGEDPLVVERAVEYLRGRIKQPL